MSEERSQRSAAARTIKPGAPVELGTALELRTQVQAFIRSFGILGAGHTPCGTPLGLSHAHALMVLLERARTDAEVVQSDLAGALGIDKSNVARLCRRMEAAGHLVQETHPRDGRARHVRLTANGRRLAALVERASQDRFVQLAALIQGGSREAVVTSLRILNEATAVLAQIPPKETSR